MIKHLALRKAFMVILFVIIFGGITMFSILQQWKWSIILGTIIIGLVLFFNISRRIYPLRQILRQSAEAKKTEHDTSNPNNE